MAPIFSGLLYEAFAHSEDHPANLMVFHIVDSQCRLPVVIQPFVELLKMSLGDLHCQRANLLEIVTGESTKVEF